MNLLNDQRKQWREFANKFIPGAATVELHPYAEYDDEGGYDPWIGFSWKDSSGRELMEPEYNDTYSNEDLVSSYQSGRWHLPYNLENGFNGRYVIRFGDV